MSDYLAQYREKNPEYSDIDDNQLTQALRNKYNVEKGAEVSQEEFNLAIGYQPAPIAEQPTPAIDPVQPQQTGVAIDPATGQPARSPDFKPMGQMVREFQEQYRQRRQQQLAGTASFDTGRTDEQGNPILSEEPVERFADRRVTDVKRGAQQLRRGFNVNEAIGAQEVLEKYEFLDKAAQMETKEEQREAYESLLKQGNNRNDLRLRFYWINRDNPEWQESKKAALRERLQTDVGDIADATAEIEALPVSEERQKFDEAEGFAEAWKAFVDAPLEVAGSLTTESAVQFSPAIPAMLLGPKTAASAAGAVSLLNEYSGDITKSLVESGVNLQSKDSIISGLLDSAKREQWKKHALDRGVPIALVDALSVRMAGMFTRQAKTGLGKTATGAGEVLGVQAPLGGAGEALGSFAAGDKADGKDILAEMIGEILPGAAETVIGALNTPKKQQAFAKALDDAITAIEVDQDAVQQEAIESLNPNRTAQPEAQPDAETITPEVLPPTPPTPAKQAASTADAKVGEDSAPQPSADAQRSVADQRDTEQAREPERGVDQVAAEPGEGSRQVEPVGATEPEQVEPLTGEASREASEAAQKSPAVEKLQRFQRSVSDDTATPQATAKEVGQVVADKTAVTDDLSRDLDEKQLQSVVKSPRLDLDKPQLVEAAYEYIVTSHDLKDGVRVVFNGSTTTDQQVQARVKEQTKRDIELYRELQVALPEIDVAGKITYPQPKPDINTREYQKQDDKEITLKREEKVFHAPGHNFIGLHRSTSLPPRHESVRIEGKPVAIPEEAQRIEPIMRQLVKITGRRIYFGKIRGKSQEGFYRPSVGEIRTRKKNDVEVLAHEMAHYLDVYSNEELPNFQKVYKNPKYNDEVKALSYTDASPELQEIEGFAEFVRLWLTNSPEAESRAPAFYQAFNKTLDRDKKLSKSMRNMRELMHKFYFQGPDKIGQALIGGEKSFLWQFNEWVYRRDSRIRQQVIDRFHAARKIEQELTKKIGNVSESAWKQFRIANGGAEGIADYILNYGTVNFAENGDLVNTGKSLHDVLQPVKTIEKKREHRKDSKIDLLMRYFAGRRALELHSQGRENLIPKETAKTWARLGKDYPVFESIHKEYQAFNDRMMDFYQESGMITAESRQAMDDMNKDYVPFFRIREGLAGGKVATTGIKKLKGGTANLNDILVNIQDGVVANVRAALTNRAKQRLYQYISDYKDGAIWAAAIAPDSRPVRVYQEELAGKVGRILKEAGVQIQGELNIDSPELLTFWQHGVKPQVNESGNIVDSVIINGKPRYYEVQDPLLQDMLISMNPESYGSFMNVMFGVKNFFTRAITLGVEFTGANLVRDTIGAAFLSKGNFIPFVDSFKGMYSFIAKDKYYQDFIKSGGGHSSRVHAQTKEGAARRRVSVDEFGVKTIPEKLLSLVDNIASAFEYGTRIGESRLNKRNNRSSMDSGFAGREISGDFSVLGANRFLTGWIRTVPFLNAMVQSQDRVFREALILKRYDGNPARLAMRGFLGITVPTLLLYMVNKDDEDYLEIPEHERRTNWHIKTGDKQFIKVPRPYDVGFAYATMPELFFKYLGDDKGKEFSDGMLWTLTQMYGIDGTPAVATGWWDLVRNEKWTGAPVVPHALSNVEATEQYSSHTSETFIRLGQATGMSPIKAEHAFKAYTGYLGGYLMSATDNILWDEERFGEKPEKKASENIFLRRFLTPEVRPSTASMEKFFDLKERSDKIVSTFKQTIDVRRSLKGQTKDPGKFKNDKFFGLSAKEKEVLFALNDSMNQVIKVIYGKNGIKTAELAIRYDKKLSGAEKRKQIDELWEARSKIFSQYYKQADKALQAAKKQAEQERKK